MLSFSFVQYLFCTYKTSLKADKEDWGVGIFESTIELAIGLTIELTIKLTLELTLELKIEPLIRSLV